MISATSERRSAIAERGALWSTLAGRRVLAATIAMAPFAAACRTDQTIVPPDPHLERMLHQEKRLAYGADPLLPGGAVMQKPPDGTVPVNAFVGDPLVERGSYAGRWADHVPIPVDRDLVENGRHGFDVFCAACHGVLGDGTSAVADRMALRKPPSLHDPRIVAYPPGRVFATVREGYGLMPSYAVQLSIDETWGVVAYVEALQLARSARVASLPPAMRERLAKEAP